MSENNFSFEESLEMPIKLFLAQVKLVLILVLDDLGGGNLSRYWPFYIMIYRDIFSGIL